MIFEKKQKTQERNSGLQMILNENIVNFKVSFSSSTIT